jgi:hypothetical protein
MNETNELLRFWMEGNRLYKRVESKGFHLSCAEKMLLRNYIDWTEQGDLLMPSIVSSRFLEDFGFDCETFRAYKKEVDEHIKGITEEYEFRGKQRRKK